MKLQKKAVLYTLLTLLWTAVIFSFSMQPATVSVGLSGGLLQSLLTWFYGLTGIHLPADLMHTIIRKTAHFCEFFLLGVLSYQASKYLLQNVQKIQKKWIALLYGALVAVADECIQFCTGAGRAMRVTDMILDTCGVATAILVMMLLTKKNKKHKNTKSGNDRVSI